MSFDHFYALKMIECLESLDLVAPAATMREMLEEIEALSTKLEELRLSLEVCLNSRAMWRSKAKASA